MQQILDQIHLTRARRDLARGRLEAAAVSLGRVGGQGQIASRTWQLKGRLFRLAGSPEAAVHCHFQSVRKPGARLSTILELAFALMRARDFERAERVLRSLIDRHPDERRAVTLLAHLHREQGRFQTALEILKSFRPRSVVGKYADVAPPGPQIHWDAQRLWHEALRTRRLDEQSWNDPAGMALDRHRRDDLICLFDELRMQPGGSRALAYGLSLALDSDAPWLMPWVRATASQLRLCVPRSLPMFLARHGDASDRGLLLAGLAEGGQIRVLSAAALISLGFDEYEEVLVEVRQTPRREVVPTEVWNVVDALVATVRA
ncbi:MAG: tetratricopeptide repeat protein [Planctomycetes bacterium]|nr:tetratricopeptide repeat protein [Planctomycetota bacterium]